MKPLRIIIVEDDPIVADDLVQCLTELGHKPIGPAYKVAVAKKLITDHHPQLALLDINLSDAEDGIDLAVWLGSKLPIPIIFLTAYTDQATLARAKETHPHHYLVKPFNPQQLKIAIEIAQANYYHPNSEQFKKTKLYKLNQSLPDPLSERELDVLRLLEEGLNNSQIADKMCISENTVKTHLKHIFVKTDSQSRSEVLSNLYRV